MLRLRGAGCGASKPATCHERLGKMANQSAGALAGSKTIGKLQALVDEAKAENVAVPGSVPDELIAKAVKRIADAKEASVVLEKLLAELRRAKGRKLLEVDRDALLEAHSNSKQAGLQVNDVQTARGIVDKFDGATRLLRQVEEADKKLMAMLPEQFRC